MPPWQEELSLLSCADGKRSRSPLGSVLGLQGQAGSGDRGPGRLNLGRQVSRVKTRSCRPSARNCPRNSSVDASTQCRSSTMNRAGRRSESARSHSRKARKISSRSRIGESPSGGSRRPGAGKGATQRVGRRPAGPGRTCSGAGPTRRTGGRPLGTRSRRPIDEVRNEFKLLFRKCGEQRHSITGESWAAWVLSDEGDTRPARPRPSAPGRVASSRTPARRPRPGSPVSRTTWPLPSWACSQRSFSRLTS